MECILFGCRFKCSSTKHSTKKPNWEKEIKIDKYMCDAIIEFVNVMLTYNTSHIMIHTNNCIVKSSNNFSLLYYRHRHTVYSEYKYG